MRWTEEQYEEYMKNKKTDKEKEKEKVVEKKSKYKNKRTISNGIIFDSKKEAMYYEKLKYLEKIGEIIEIELQPKFLLQEGFIKGDVKHRPIYYIADFRVKHVDGREEVIDVKSSKTYKTQVYKLKKKIFEYKYKDLTIKEIYEVDLTFG